MTQAVQAHDNAGWFTAAVAEELRAQLARKRVSGRELARRLHVSAQWISQRTKGEMPLRVDEIERICEVLGITVVELIADAAKRVAQPTPVDQGEAVTGTYTPRFPPPTERSRPSLSLVPPLPVSYLGVAQRNGSSPPAASYGEYPIVDRSAGTVNHADAS